MSGRYGLGSSAISELFPGCRECMELLKLRDIVDDVDEDPFDVYVGEEDELPAGSLKTVENLATSYDDNRTVLYGVAASLVLHLLIFLFFSRSGAMIPTKALLSPGEKVTSVRLVEPPQEAKKPEPPPEKASAISDRDHTAAVERIPKRPPSPKSPLGRMEPHQQRIASLAPPAAPEEPLRQKTPKEKVEQSDRPRENEPAKHSIPAARDKKSLRNLDVDLRPTPGEIAQGLSMPGGPQDFFQDGDPEEAVVDINTREDKFFSYLLHLKQKIQGVWIYPAEAARSGLGGSLTVEFGIANDGRLLYVNLIDSSGHSTLDQSAVRAIKTAAPYYPFPPRMKSKRMKIRANFIYVTGNPFRRIM